MSNFDNTDKGALHKNERKTEDRYPDYKGDAMPVCAHCGQKSAYWLSAWIKTARNGGKKWMSIAFQKKDDQPKVVGFEPQKTGGYANKPAIKPNDSHSIDFDDDIPF